MASRRDAEIYEPLNLKVGIPLGREVFPPVCAKDHTSGLSQSDVLMLAERVSRLNLRTGQCVPGSKRSTLFNRTRRTILTAKIKPWQNTLIWKGFVAQIQSDGQTYLVRYEYTASRSGIADIGIGPNTNVSGHGIIILAAQIEFGSQPPSYQKTPL